MDPVPDTRCMIPGTLYAVTWYSIPAARYLVPDTWHLVPDTSYQIPGTRYLVPGTYPLPGTGYLVTGTWYKVPGSRYLVPATRSLVPERLFRKSECLFASALDPSRSRVPGFPRSRVPRSPGSNLDLKCQFSTLTKCTVCHDISKNVGFQSLKIQHPKIQTSIYP